MGRRIVLAEDEEDLAFSLRFNLEQEGYEVTVVGRGDAVRQAVEEHRPDLLLLDIMLPGQDGFSILRELRAARDRTPVLCLTARAREVDKVMGLKLGADDYLAKPFGIAELLARIEAILRRSRERGEASAPRVHRIGEATVDLAACTVSRAGKTHKLTAYERGILQLLLSEPGKAWSRDEILQEVWGYDRMPTTRTVDTHVARLRKKIESDPEVPRHLVTVHGVGYAVHP